MSRVFRLLPVAALAALLPGAPASQAAESGSGLYIGGSSAFGAGATPPPGFYATVGAIAYDGDVDRVVADGVVDLNVRKTVFAALGNALYVSPYGLFGGNAGISATLPFANHTALEASASGAVTGNLSTSGWGVGDISLKIQNGWSHGSFAHTVSLTTWLPTGTYATGFQPNAGKNHVGFDASWAFTKVWKESGIELSSAIGYTIELENPSTNYRNGDTFHLEAALGYQFAPGWTAGVAGYGITQVTGDSGSGATLGDFKRRTYAVGPAFGYSTRIGGKGVSFIGRHFREFGVENSFQGHVTFMSGTMRF